MHWVTPSPIWLRSTSSLRQRRGSTVIQRQLQVPFGTLTTDYMFHNVSSTGQQQIFTQAPGDGTIRPATYNARTEPLQHTCSRPARQQACINCATTRQPHSAQAHFFFDRGAGLAAGSAFVALRLAWNSSSAFRNLSCLCFSSLQRQKQQHSSNSRHESHMFLWH